MRIAVGGTHLFFDVDGQKYVPDGAVMAERPTIILLHGGPGFDHSSFKPSYAPLAALGQVIYLDQRGHGHSDPVEADELNLARWADDVADFCAALDIEDPVIYGLSFGGMVAQAVAIRHPTLSRRVILDSTVPQMRLDLTYEAFERIGGRELRLTAERFWTNPDNGDHMAAYMAHCLPLYSRSPQDPMALQRVHLRPEILSHFFASQGEGRSFDFRDQLRDSGAKFLVLSGELDPITPPEAAAAFREALPAEQLTFVRVSNAGHGVFRDEPGAAFEAIRAFILS